MYSNTFDRRKVSTTEFEGRHSTGECEGRQGVGTVTERNFCILEQMDVKTYKSEFVS